MIPVRNIILIVVGIVLVGLGFFYLARGSITLAPILLIAGYCVAVPLGIILGAPGDGREPRRVGQEGE